MAPAAPGIDPDPSLLGRADEVRIFDGTTTFDETNSLGDESTASATIEIEDAIELLAVRSTLYAVPVEATQLGSPVDLSAVVVDSAAGVVQLSTRSSFAGTGADGDVPSGVYVHEHWQTQTIPGIEDEVNSLGGLGGGPSGDVGKTLWLPQVSFPENVEQNLQGVTFSIHYRLTTVPDGEIQLRLPTWLYIRLR